jgi:hypothetical protein
MEERDSLDFLQKTAYYGLICEHIQDLIILSVSKSERKALGVLYYLLRFVEGKRRFPRSRELPEIVSDCLDRNLDRDTFYRKYNLNPHVDQVVDDPETFYLETLGKIALVRQLQEGWSGWKDGR